MKDSNGMNGTNGHVPKTMKTLEDLLPGKHLSVQDKVDTDSGLPLPPEGFDMEKFHRGRRFFRDNLFSCTVGMFFNLILGLCIPDFLKTLVWTNKSDTPERAFKRYWSTYQHIATWHYGNVWHEGSEAQKSIRLVRQMHIKVKKDLKRDGYSNYVSQYHMALVQSPFLMFPLLHPAQCGITCTEENLDDYVYFWYGIGWLLGIEDAYNVCSLGKEQARVYCREVQDKILMPNLETPPDDFFMMSSAIVEGWRAVFRGTLSVPVAMSFCQKAAGKKNKTLEMFDGLRYVLWSSVFVLVRELSLFKSMMNKLFEKVFKLRFHDA